MRILPLLIFLLLFTGLASGANLAGNYAGNCISFEDPDNPDNYDINLTVHRHAHGRFRVTGTFARRIGSPYYTTEIFPFSARVYHVRDDRGGTGEVVSSTGAFRISLPDGLTGKVVVTKDRPAVRKYFSSSSLFFLSNGSRKYDGNLFWDDGNL